MTNNFAPISAKNITDLGIPSDLCSVEILAVTIGVYYGAPFVKKMI